MTDPVPSRPAERELDAAVLKIVRQRSQENPITTDGLWRALPFSVRKSVLGAALRRLHAAGHIAEVHDV